MGKPASVAYPRLLGTALFLLCTSTTCRALYADEAGVNDFVIRTAGHGQVGVRYASLINNENDSNSGVWVTSQSNEFPGAVSDGSTANNGKEAVKSVDPIIGKVIMSDGEDASSCSISGRNVTSGQVLWRVNACSNTKKISANSEVFTPRHVALASSTYSKVVYSMDNMGAFRGWNFNDGMLQFDTDVLEQINAIHEKKEGGDPYRFPGNIPRLLDTSYPRIIGTVVSTEGGDESLVLMDTKNGEPIPSAPSSKEDTQPNFTLSAKSLLANASVSKRKYDTARIVDATFVKRDNSDKKHEGHLAVLVAWSSTSQDIAAPKGSKVTKSVSSFSSMAVIDIIVKEVIETSKPPEASAPKSEDYDDWSTTLIKSISYTYKVAKGTPLNVSGSVGSTPILLSSLRKVVDGNNNVTFLAVAATTSQLVLVNNVSIVANGNVGGTGHSYEMDMLHPYWRLIDNISVPKVDDGSDVATLTIAGVDDRYPTPRRIESLFVLSLANSEGGEPFNRIHGVEKKSDEEIMHSAMAICSTFESTGLVVTALEDGDDVVVMPYAVNDGKSAWSSTQFDGSASIVSSVQGGASSIGNNDRAHLLECSQESMTVAFTTTSGITTVFRFQAPLLSGTIQSTKLWTSEEALGSISSAVFLDETHAMTIPSDLQEDAGGNADFEEEQALRNLEFSSRIKMQLESLRGCIFGGGLLTSLKSIAIMSDEKKAERDIAFGFAKVAVLLSENMHRVVALDTMKRNVIWAMNLHSGALWHKIVHGGQFTSLNDSHGNGGVNDHEMLALSYVERGSSLFVEWKCFDGLSGRTFAGDTSLLSAPISQIVPLRTSSHLPHPHDSSGCRQVALLVHSDSTVSVIPDTARSRAIVNEAAGKNGLFVHGIDKHTGEFRSQIVSEKTGSDSFDLVTIGTTVFDPSQEKIINVAYPRRGEVIQSPSTVLGDESLLLKYLNPHLVVVVTEATPVFFSEMKPDADTGSSNGFYNSLSTGSSSSQQMRKPLGAAKPGEGPPSVTNTAAPSLFVTLVDSVSGQILHRVSHSHVDSPDELLESTHVPVIVSENWVVYAFFNQRTRRTDVGVLTLHEGMIDKNGITAFSAPEQELIFSSLESAKPIVLSRTFGLAKAVSALGVTSTKAGISSKQFLFATGNDQVISLDRRFLDPRRPSGDLKDSEKMEGLMRYAPMLPIIPFLTPSHVHEVSSVHSIASAAAHVESQSLVLAYGGPDIFFSRVSPSKGFDLLPDDFNRGLLTLVVVGLLVALNVIQRMNKKKMVTSFWS